ncbi:hypothetical protein CVT26_016213 [Gymnopilus dilepis]|uniref:Uncharacterized protein n=1 Tax=Gymnopilus dilepis TaxID=231916 RepID=A0A409XYY9_9AGAR|nr:hypothetical protein CVT26_016213 [Gymnopilus dilepis]
MSQSDCLHLVFHRSKARAPSRPTFNRRHLPNFSQKPIFKRRRSEYLRTKLLNLNFDADGGALPSARITSQQKHLEDRFAVEAEATKAGGASAEAKLTSGRDLAPGKHLFHLFFFYMRMNLTTHEVY